MEQFIMSKFTSEKDLYKAKAEHFEKQAAAFQVILEDFAKFGLRSDMNPTRSWDAKTTQTFRAAMGEYDWWSEYMKSADMRVRERARAVLNVSS